MRWRDLFYGASMAVSLAVAARDAPPPIVGVASVIDGDTIEIHGSRIRLFGVDAPESRQTCVQESKPWKCGAASANALDIMIDARTVSCEQVDTDRYKRAVAKCTVGDVSINSWLVREGWAIDYEKYSHGAYAPDQDEAKSARRGIWASEFDNPEEVRRQGRTGRK
mgnify:CR=1 FL=1